MRKSKSVWSSTGATLVEFAITLPIALLLIFAIIDLSIVIASRTIIADALYLAGAEGSRSSSIMKSECRERARRAFQDRISKIGFVARMGQIQADFAFLEIVPRTMRATVRARIPCVFFCPLLMSGSGLSITRSGPDGIDYKALYDFILEDETRCASPAIE